MLKDILERPFEPSQIKTRRGPSGVTLSYAETQSYIQRLNEAFDHKWDFEIVEFKIFDNEVVVIAQITAYLEDNKIIKTSVGGMIIKKDKDGKPYSVADDLKAAQSDALKKACSLFGIGLHLYGGFSPQESPSPTPHKEDNVIPIKSKKITQKQLSAIWVAARKLEVDQEKLRAECLRAYKSQLEHLSKKDAAHLLDRLNKGIEKRQEEQE